MFATMRPEYPLTVFFDGGCPVCSREMAFIRKQTSGAKLIFIDISRPDFDPAPYGRSRKEFMAKMHAMDAKGRFLVGVDAFRALWQTMPGTLYPCLAKLTGLPGIHALARLGYRVFARLRRYLPPVGK
jgi:predicted DCC family thiol-disulfide oxidoreductase YuxK